jgi:hypothetical protein
VYFIEFKHKEEKDKLLNEHRIEMSALKKKLESDMKDKRKSMRPEVSTGPPLPSRPQSAVSSDDPENDSDSSPRTSISGESLPAKLQGRTLIDLKDAKGKIAIALPGNQPELQNKFSTYSIHKQEIVKTQL